MRVRVFSPFFPQQNGVSPPNIHSLTLVALTLLMHMCEPESNPHGLARNQHSEKGEGNYLSYTDAKSTRKPDFCCLHYWVIDKVRFLIPKTNYVAPWLVHLPNMQSWTVETPNQSERRFAGRGCTIWVSTSIFIFFCKWGCMIEGALCLGARLSGHTHN